LLSEMLSLSTTQARQIGAAEPAGRCRRTTSQRLGMSGNSGSLPGDGLSP
jgi:hypothetical protein